MKDDAMFVHSIKAHYLRRIQPIDFQPIEAGLELVATLDEGEDYQLAYTDLMTQCREVVHSTIRNAKTAPAAAIEDKIDDVDAANAAANPVVETPASAEPAEKPKRKRRTKEQMLADRADTQRSDRGGVDFVSLKSDGTDQLVPGALSSFEGGLGLTDSDDDDDYAFNLIFVGQGG